MPRQGAPSRDADEMAEAGVGEMSGGDEDRLVLQHVHDRVSGAAGQAGLDIEDGAPIGVVGLSRVVGYIAQDVAALAARSDHDGDVAGGMAWRGDGG